jgi:hypothetical protein
MFSLPAVVLTEPKRPPLSSRERPRMILSALDGPEFAALRDATPRFGKPTYTLADPAGRTALTVAVSPRKSARTRFEFTDGQGRTVGAAQGRSLLFPALELQVSCDGSADVLHLRRTAVAGSAWLVKDHTDAELVRVTASSAALVTVRQRYEIHFDALITPPQRRVMVGAVIAVHALRRWLGGD